MKRFNCLLRLSCEYHYVLEVEAETREAAMEAAAQEGQHLDIDKMEQSWSPVEVDEDETREVVSCDHHRPVTRAARVGLL